MHPIGQTQNTADYQAAIDEASNAFMKVMALRGYSVRDYPQNFVAHMAGQARLHFESSRRGPHPEADQLVAQFLFAGQAVATPRKPAATKGKTIPFPMLRRRAA